MVLISLTPEETLNILKALSRLDGYLMAIPKTSDVLSELDYTIDLLTNKLLEKQDDRLY